MNALLQDLRFAARSLAKNPAFAAVGVCTLALGIGANAAVFSLVDGMLLRPLPVKDPAELVALYSLHGPDRRPEAFSYPNYLDYRSKSAVFRDVIAQAGVPLSLSTGERAEMVWGEMVTSNYFDVLGVKPALGRMFRETEDRGPGSLPLAVLSDTFWQAHFASDPQVVGKTVRLNGHPFTIVGVAPPGFTETRLFAFLPDLWVPLAMHAQVLPGSDAWLETERGSRSLIVMARLLKGVGPREAQAAISAFSKNLASEHAPGEVDPDVLVLAGELPFAAPGFVPRKILLYGAAASLVGVGLVLVISCANVTGLLLARATARRREVAIRSALGASRRRITRLLLAESLLLATMGGVGGVFLAALALRYQGALVPPSPFRLGFEAGIDSRVLAFALAVSALATVLSGLAPALHASRTNLVSALKEEGPLVARARRIDLRSVLVVGQLAFSLVLLVSGGLFLKSLLGARDLPLGFETKNGLVLSVNPGLQGYDEARGRTFYDRLVERVRALPAVESAALAYPLPLDFSTLGTEVTIDGRDVSPEEQKVSVLESVVDRGYFETMGTPIVRGRPFTDADRASTRAVAVINETMAEKYWPRGDALGRVFRFAGSDKPVEVVGIARDGKYAFLTEAPRPYLFLPLAQNYESQITLVVRTVSDPEGVASALRDEVKALDPDLAAFGVLTLDQFKRRSLSGAESGAVLSSAFAVLALALAAVGVYGVVAFSVGQRTREIGIRMALGAPRPRVLRLVLWDAAKLAAVGVSLGLMGAWALGRLIGGLLYGARGSDLGVFAFAPLLLVATTLLAGMIPALRATRIDPNRALHLD